MTVDYRLTSIPDHEFIRGKVPMTKEEIRTVTMSKLRLTENATVLDIGAGTGSLSIECALKAPKGHVYAVERNEEGVSLIGQNKEKFKASNVEIISGLAPEALPTDVCFNSIILGGTGGNMTPILDYCHANLKEGGWLVANMITLENMSVFLNYAKEHLKNVEVVQINVSKSKMVKDITMMMANNPIFIISAQKITEVV
jgi:cobalt-precorrin-6B (C15)-methyltransferase